jgi:hypothetical protein
VSERPGHARNRFTLDTYTHLLPYLQDRAADAKDAAQCGAGIASGTHGIVQAVFLTATDLDFAT